MSDLSAMSRSPLDGLNVPSTLGLAPAADLTRYVLRGREAVLPAVEAVLGFALPREACRAAGHGDRHALWLGPDERLLLSPAGDAMDKAIAFAAGDAPHALVEVSNRQLGLTLSGPNATAILSVGCALDLDLSAFPVSMCTRTMLAKAEIVLWRTGPDAFHIEVWRSFAVYLWRYLELSGAEFA